MKMPTLDTALHEQYRDPAAYLDQTGNVLRGVLRLAGWWATATITSSVGVAIVAFLATDLSTVSLDDAQQALRLTVTGVGIMAALAGWLGDVGRFRNMFRVRASAKVERFEALRTEVESQLENMEQLLVWHRLITEADVDRRRLELQGEVGSGRASAEQGSQV